MAKPPPSAEERKLLAEKYKTGLNVKARPMPPLKKRLYYNDSRPDETSENARDQKPNDVPIGLVIGVDRPSNSNPIELVVTRKSELSDTPVSSSVTQQALHVRDDKNSLSDSTIPEQITKSHLKNEDALRELNRLSVSNPLPSPQAVPNLGITQVEVRQILDITKAEPRLNLDITQAQPRQNLGIDESSEVHAYEKAYFRDAIIDEDSNLDKTYAKPRFNLGITDLEVRQNLGIDSHDADANLGKTQVKLRSKPRHEPRQNLGKTSVKVSQDSFASLVGLQRKIILFVYDDLVRTQDTITGAITSTHFSEITQAPVQTVQGAVKELIRKEILIRVEFKNGRGGWTRYALEKMIYQEINSLDVTGKLRQNLGITQAEPRQQPRHKPRHETLSSSSIINTNTTETREADPMKPPLSEEWKTQLDWTALETCFGPVSINEKTGVFRNQFDLATNSEIQTSPPLTTTDVQNSIDKMAWDYEHGIYEKNSPYLPRARLFGILNRRGHYNNQASGFKTRKTRDAEQLTQQMEEETKAIKQLQDAKFNLVQEKWLQIQNLSLIKTKLPVYSLAKTDEQLIGLVKGHFKQQNYSRIVYEDITDPTQLAIDFNQVDQ